MFDTNRSQVKTTIDGKPVGADIGKNGSTQIEMKLKLHLSELINITIIDQFCKCFENCIYI